MPGGPFRPINQAMLAVCTLCQPFNQAYKWWPSKHGGARFLCYLPTRLLLQIESLKGLRSLEVCGLRCPSPAAYRGLSALASLTRLQFYFCAAVPECLGALPMLRHLSITTRDDGAPPDDACLALQAALMQLQQLTCLMIASQLVGPDTLTAISGMGSLQRLLLTIECRLPPGPWLHSLRWLAATHVTLLDSMEALGAAGQLEYLSVLGVPAGGECYATEAGTWCAFWRWAEGHAPLRCLGLNSSDDDNVASGILAGAVRLQRRRPALTVLCCCSDVDELDNSFTHFVRDDHPPGPLI